MYFESYFIIICSRGFIDNKLALVEITAWCQTGDKPWYEVMVAWFGDAYKRHSAPMS